MHTKTYKTYEHTKTKMYKIKKNFYYIKIIKIIVKNKKDNVHKWR